jgi:Carboxypeptidase regulatory-like domain/Putative zinc-finger
MSELIQAGQHPDADQLNAFVEHALPLHEQQQTMAHLAVCPACRQIVALSLPPGDELPTRKPEAVRQRWFPRWHPAWAGIPALAAVILVVFFVRNGGRVVRQTPGPTQMADARPPAPPAPPVANPPPDTARNAAPVARHLNQQRAADAAKQLPPVVQREPAGGSGSAGGVMGGILGGIGSGPMQPAAPAQSFASSSASAGAPVTAFAAARVPSVLSTPSPLPSHLAVLSMASHANQRLAIDTENHLFFSDDAGKNWKAVPSQWKGRAVGVALIYGVSTSGAATAALKMSSRAAGTTDPMLSGTMMGTVKDPSGTVIPGATLVATNSSGVIVGSATSDGRGQFRMEDLAPGNYRVEAQAAGFEKQSFAAEVAPAQQAVADVTLRVASAAQTVTIQASPGRLDTTLETAKPPTNPSVSQTLSRFELTTDDGERWTSIDGQSWNRE